jgi:hypothetical protein
MTTVFIYIDTNKDVGDPDHLKVFATPEAADEWFKEHNPEGVVFGRSWSERIGRRTTFAMLLIVALAILWNLLPR